MQENELVSVLNTAQGLEIKGLSENTTPPSLPNNISKPEHVFTNSTNHTPKRPLPPQSRVSEKRPKILETNDLKASTTQEIAPGPSGSLDPGPGSFETTVKQEITPVTIDLDDGDGIESVEPPGQQVGLSGFEGLGQELAFCDTSNATGYEDVGGYDEGEYFAGMEPHTEEVDRVGLFCLFLFGLLWGFFSFLNILVFSSIIASSTNYNSISGTLFQQSIQLPHLWERTGKIFCT